MIARSTYRKPAGVVCYQKQLRDRYVSEGTPPVPHLSVKRAQVRPVSRRLAEQIILKYEWLGTMVSSSLHYGLFFGPYCAGVVCYAINGSGTAGPYVHRRFNVDRAEVATLARGACVHWAPKGSNSRLVSKSCRFIAERGYKIILAYSDTDAGEIGTIYQACNWYYTGKTFAVTRGAQFVSPRGVIRNRMLLQQVAKKNKVTTKKARELLLSEGWREQQDNAKHRYVYILDRSDTDLVQRVENMALPYPKRAGSIVADAPAVQVGEGGATPTPALN